MHTPKGYISEAFLNFPHPDRTPPWEFNRATKKKTGVLYLGGGYDGCVVSNFCPKAAACFNCVSAFHGPGILDPFHFKDVPFIQLPIHKCQRYLYEKNTKGFPLSVQFDFSTKQSTDPRVMGCLSARHCMLH